MIELNVAAKKPDLFIPLLTLEACKEAWHAGKVIGVRQQEGGIWGDFQSFSNAMKLTDAKLLQYMTQPYGMFAHPTRIGRCFVPYLIKSLLTQKQLFYVKAFPCREAADQYIAGLGNNLIKVYTDRIFQIHLDDPEEGVMFV